MTTSEKQGCAMGVLVILSIIGAGIGEELNNLTMSLSCVGVMVIILIFAVVRWRKE